MSHEPAILAAVTAFFTDATARVHGARDIVFRNSAPAPVDGVVPAYWRVKDRDAMSLVLLDHGYDNRRAYVEGDGRCVLWVGIRDNRDRDHHAAELRALRSVLVGLGFRVRMASFEGRPAGLRVYDHAPLA